MGEGAKAAAARPPRAGGGYLSLVDGVRGIAAVAVLLYHYVHFFMTGPVRSAPEGTTRLFPAYDLLWPFYEYGYFAVQIFWLISGFVFAHVYYGQDASTRSFAVNRFARLYPLHLLTLLLVTVLQFVALHRLGYTPIYGKYDLPHFAKQLFMASDWLHEDGGYSFNGPVWSVSVEIVIYAVFWASRGIVARLGLPVVAVLVAAFYWLHQHHADWSNAFACGFYFFAGCGLTLLRRHGWGQGWRLAVLCAILVVGGIGGTAKGGDWGWRYLGLPGLFGAAFMLLAALEKRAGAGLRKVCEWLGENTYGVYLWHFPVQLVLILLLLPRFAPAEIARNGWFLLGFVALVVIVARLSYIHFERPARDWLRRRLGSRAPTPKGGDNAP